MEDTTPIYNLKAVIRETGLSPATLRAWERRYGLLKPQRSTGGHRLYSEQEIAMLKWLVARQEEGLTISHAVELWQNILKNDQDPYNLSPTVQKTRIDDAGLEKLRKRWISACLEYDESQAEQVLAQAFSIAPPEAVCTEVLQKGLAEIGERWYSGTINVQQEHFASALAVRRLHALFSAAPRPTRPGRLLAACPPGEAHDFSLLLIAFILRQHGWDVVYLGANVPLSHLDHTLQQTAPRLVLSVSQTLHSAASLREMAGYVNQHGIPLAYGGGIFNIIPALTARIPGYFLGQELGNVPQVVEHLLSQTPALPQPQPISPEYAALLRQFVTQESAILASVSATLQTAQVGPKHLEDANNNFSRYVTAALSLGDIHYLDSSVSWLNGLLENYGLSPAMSTLYYVAFRQAVQRHLGDQAAPIQDWLAQFDR